MEMKSPARGDLTMPGKEGVSLPGPSRCPRPYQGPTLLQDVAIMHWNGRCVGGPLSSTRFCGAVSFKAGMGGVGQRASSSEQGEAGS